MRAGLIGPNGLKPLPLPGQRVGFNGTFGLYILSKPYKNSGRDSRAGRASPSFLRSNCDRCLAPAPMGRYL